MQIEGEIGATKTHVATVHADLIDKIALTKDAILTAIDTMRERASNDMREFSVKIASLDGRTINLRDGLTEVRGEINAVRADVRQVEAAAAARLLDLERRVR